MKTFKFHNATISVIPSGRGQYVISGLGKQLHSTDSEIYDWVNDDSNKSRQKSARRDAYNFLRNN